MLKIYEMEMDLFGTMSGGEVSFMVVGTPYMFDKELLPNFVHGYMSQIEHLVHVLNMETLSQALM